MKINAGMTNYMIQRKNNTGFLKHDEMQAYHNSIFQPLTMVGNIREMSNKQSFKEVLKEKLEINK